MTSKGKLQAISLTISAVDENVCGFVVYESSDTGKIVVSITVYCGLDDTFIVLSAENFLLNSGDVGTCCLLLLGGFDKPTEPGKKFGTVDASFLIVSICCLASIFDDGSVFIV